MARREQFDTVVIGAGPAGLTAATLLAKAGLATACISSPDTRTKDDPRTVALMRPALALLERLDIWPQELQAQTAPLKQLRLIDDQGGIFASDPVSFFAYELGYEAFGYNFPLSLLMPALLDAAKKAGVKLIAAMATRYNSDSDNAEITLDNGALVRTRAAIAADGASSLMRRQAGISATEWAYRQSAMVTVFSHSQPHNDISYEFHKTGGPFTTVPMPANRSSLVWMGRGELASEISNLNDAQLCKRLQREMHGTLGLITDASPIKSFAMRGLSARQFARNRLYLIGEAAHLMPPIGAQGLNLSLRDAALAAEIITNAHRSDADLASACLLNDYDTRRRRDILPRQSIVHLMNAGLLSSLPGINIARLAGLDAITRLPMLKQWVMQQGLAGEHMAV